MLIIVVRVETLLIVELPINHERTDGIAEFCGPVRGVLFALPKGNNDAKFDDLNRIFYQILLGTI